MRGWGSPGERHRSGPLGRHLRLSTGLGVSEIPQRTDLRVAGRGPTPKPPELRRNQEQKARGDWLSTDADGWQHGPIPKAPTGLLKASREAWEIWFSAWFAAHWTPEDIPGLRQIIRLYDQVERGEFQRAAELRLQMDTYGITPKGQQDRRWQRPKRESDPEVKGKVLRSDRWADLKAVDQS